MRRIAILALALAAALPLAPLAGCGGDTAKLLESVPASAQDAMKNYLAQLGDLNKLLAGVTNQQQALTAIPKLQPLADKLNESVRALTSAEPAAQDALRKAFADELKPLAEAFDAQTKRIAGLEGAGKTLAPILNKLRLF